MNGFSWIVGPQIKTEINALMGEVYTAFHNDSRRLAAMGIRAILEAVMIDRVGDKGTIGENVKAFLATGLVSDQWKEVFRDTLIEAGHAAMHRKYDPTKEQLEALLDLTEWLIVSIYEHPNTASNLKAKIPGRTSLNRTNRASHNLKGLKNANHYANHCTIREVTKLLILLKYRRSLALARGANNFNRLYFFHVSAKSQYVRYMHGTMS